MNEYILQFLMSLLATIFWSLKEKGMERAKPWLIRRIFKDEELAETALKAFDNVKDSLPSI